jgi:hypothetical protein
MSKKTNTLYWIILVFILLIIIFVFSYLQQTKEYFDILLKNDFPLTKNQNLTTNSASDVWKDKPVFKLGSFSQITNNLKYFRNPDIGDCSPEEFCGSLYKDKNHPRNTADWLTPVSTAPSEIRVNYYNTQPNLVI